MKKLRILSLFSGCGGLDLGFIMANENIRNFKYEVVWANDFNQYACETYKRNFGDHIVWGDITDPEIVDFDKTPDCDIILGGFPCQDFSMLWKRGGIDTDRGNLYLQFVKAVEKKRPIMFVAENVKGLLSANKGQAIKKITEEFAAKGYNLSYYLYNAADYGVAQLRERVIMVGIRNDAVFKKDVNEDVKEPVFFPRVTPTHANNHVSSKEALEGVENILDNNEKMNIKERTKRIIDAIPAGGNFTDIPKESELYVKGMISHVYRRLHPDKPSTTIIAAGGGGTWGYHYSEPRPLTNRERARLQSFPDWFVFEGSVAEVRRQIGNAVPPKLSQAAAESIAAFLEEIEFTKTSQAAKETKYEQIELTI